MMRRLLWMAAILSLLMTVPLGCRKKNTPDAPPTWSNDISDVGGGAAEAAPPADPLAECEPGRWGTEGMILDCMGLRIIWGYASGRLEGNERLMVASFEEAMRAQHEDTYTSRVKQLEVGRDRFSGVTYTYTERIKEMPPEDIEVAGRYHVVKDMAGEMRVLHCAGTPQIVDERCEKILTELALGGVPSQYMPYEPRPKGEDSVVPRFAGEPVIMGEECEVKGPGEVMCGEVLLYWRRVSDEEQGGFEETFVQNLKKSAEKEAGTVRDRKRACTIGEQPVECRWFNVRGGTDRSGQILVGGARVRGERTVAMCAWPDSMSKQVPAFCRQVIRPR